MKQVPNITNKPFLYNWTAVKQFSNMQRTITLCKTLTERKMFKVAPNHKKAPTSKFWKIIIQYHIFLGEIPTSTDRYQFLAQPVGLNLFKRNL